MRGFGNFMICGAIVASFGSATAANAAASARNVPVKLEPLSKEEFATLRSQLGACVVEKNKAQVAKFLAHSDSLTTDFAAMGVQPQMFIFSFKMDQCQKYNPPQMGQYLMKPGVFRSMLMENAYLAKTPSAPQPILNDKGEPAPAPVRSYVSRQDQLAQATAFAELADCTAANGTAMADAVLRTGAGMPDERQAAVALAPVIGQCIPAGMDIKLTPDTIRGLAAEGMWQRYASVTTSTQVSAN